MEKSELASLLTKLLFQSMTKPNKEIGWKAGSSMYNLIDSLTQMGVDLTKIKPNE